MKKLLPLILLISTICSPQNIRSYNISVNQGDESQVGELFKEFHGKHKRKSGAITLQRVQFLNDVTHRILLTGNPNNWGWEVQPPESEWQAYRRGNMAYRKSAPGSYTGKSLYWKDGDRSKYNVGRQWFFKANDRVKFASAYVKFAKAIEAEEWNQKSTGLHMHSLKSMWYETDETRIHFDNGMVQDISYPDGRIERFQNGKLIHIFGNKLSGDELLSAYLNKV